MIEPNFDLYYNPYEVRDRDALITMCTGGRGVGKTVGYKYMITKDFLDNGWETVWVRRNMTAIEEMCRNDGFGRDVEKFFDEPIFNDSGTAYIDDKPYCHFIPLTCATKYKSVPFPRVKTMIFDEFIIGANDRTQRYLSNEVHIFLNLISTVFRDRDDGWQVFLIGNHEVVDNPYFSFFKVYPTANQRFTRKGDILVESYKSQKFYDHMTSTRFGKLIKDTTFGGFALENKSLDDNEANIMSFDSNMIFICGYLVEDKRIGVWINKNGNIIISNKFNDNGRIYNLRDAGALIAHMKYSKSQAVEAIKLAVSRDELYYENLLAKRTFLDYCRQIF